MDQEQQTTNNIKVPNKNMEVLQAQFPQCFAKDGQFDLEKFKQELSTSEVDFYKESYGLDWLGKSYARLLASDEATTLLWEDEAHNQKSDNQNSQNLLLKGDNLEVLKHLSNAYYEKVKMIYIDPPYNTGEDFVYEDNRKFTVPELRQLAGVDEEKARRILEFTQSKSNSHSAWLTFMYPRLYIARRLLREDGVIFVSIDDNEVSQLRLVMDEVFGEENFVASIMWQKKYAVSNDDPGIGDMHDFILCFQKTNAFQRNLLPRTEKQLSRYTNPDNDPRGFWSSDNYVSNKSREERPTLWYPIKHPKTGEEVWPDESAVWRYSKDKHEVMVKENRLFWGKDFSYQKPRLKRFLTEIQDGLVPNTWWEFGEVGHNDEGQKETAKLLAKKVFSTPKPVRLLRKMLHIGTSGNDIILDFFAGSGSTGDAVMQLNAEDGGHRKYILVQLPEALDKKKDKTSYDFVKDELGVAEPTIFEITKERLIRAAKKVKEETIAGKIAEKEKELAKLAGELDMDGKTKKGAQLKAEIVALKDQDLGFRIFETMPIWEDYGLEG